jgi:hypothetical protein
MLGPLSGRGGRWVGQMGGEIWPVHVYRNEEEIAQIAPEFSSF